MQAPMHVVCVRTNCLCPLCVAPCRRNVDNLASQLSKKKFFLAKIIDTLFVLWYTMGSK